MKGLLLLLAACSLDRGPNTGVPNPGVLATDAGPELTDSMAQADGPIEVWELQVTEVSVRQFGAYRNATGAGYTPKTPTTSDCNYPDRPEHPMNCIRRDEAEGYCAWYGGRLPTGEEWRAFGGRSWELYPWGDEPPDCDVAHYAGCPADDDAVTRRVGATQKHGNFWDMAGNVFEWMADGMIRGGSFVSAPEHLELDFASNNHQSPEQQHIGIGFRCTRQEME